MMDSNEHRLAVKLLKDGTSFGVLSTLSLELDGAPFGSVVNYAIDQSGLPLLYISTIAEHTNNAEADSRASLTILANQGGNVQAEARITITGKLVKATDTKRSEEQYFRYFPVAKSYAQFHDFAVYRLEPSSIRYIGGFGKIFWIEPKDVFEAFPLNQAEEQFMINHMNDHHLDSIVLYLQAYAGFTPEPDAKPELIAVAAGHMTIRNENQRFAIPLSKSIANAQEAREVITEMSKAARLKLG